MPTPSFKYVKTWCSLRGIGLNVTIPLVVLNLGSVILNFFDGISWYMYKMVHFFLWCLNGKRSRDKVFNGIAESLLTSRLLGYISQRFLFRIMCKFVVTIPSDGNARV